jgi:D-sedoheptulose 7-phosphate isomerase
MFVKGLPMSKEIISHALSDARAHLDALLANEFTLMQIEEAGNCLAESLQGGGRVFSCGNGGSLCDATHFAEELSGRYRKNRRALAATAISDAAHISCVANDFGYEQVFSRYIEAHGRRGDCLIAISTSGTSKNVLLAAQAAKEIGMTVIGMTGRTESPLDAASDVLICTPAGRYADRVQELHIKVLHILIELVESKLGLAQPE